MRINETHEARIVVTADDSAKALAISPEDDFPDVFATSRMVALTKIAAARAMRDVLGAGQLSVGVDVKVRHLAATPIGREVYARATFAGMEGKLYRFSGQAYDAGGLIGEGEHTRAVVTTERLVKGAAVRAASAIATSPSASAGSV
jgi:predicted thioesterase